MLILVLMLLPALGMGPLWIWDLYSKTYQKERTQIALDNAAIVMGREERQIWNSLKRHNSRVQALEKAHHALHALARTPLVLIRPDLIFEDEAMEKALQGMTVAATAQAQMGWTKALILGTGELKKLETESSIKRPVVAPVHPVICTVCGLAVELEVDSPLPESHLKSQAFGGIETFLRASGESLRSGPDWNYELDYETRK